jgi:hypothetical protein
MEPEASLLHSQESATRPTIVSTIDKWSPSKYSGSKISFISR